MWAYFSDGPTEMVVTWVTKSSSVVSLVEYGRNDLMLTATGFEEIFVDGGPKRRVLYMHRVKITGLACGQKYGSSNFVSMVALLCFVGRFVAVLNGII